MKNKEKWSNVYNQQTSRDIEKAEDAAKLYSPDRIERDRKKYQKLMKDAEANMQKATATGDTSLYNLAKSEYDKAKAKYAELNNLKDLATNDPEVARRRREAGAAKNEREKAAAISERQRNKWAEEHKQYIKYESSTRGKVSKVVKKAKTKIKDLAKSYQDTYNLGMDMVMNFLKR